MNPDSLLNQQQKAIEVLLGNIDTRELYTGVLTRARIGVLYDKYYGVIQQLQLNEDIIIRALIIACLRYVNNMTVSDLSILMILGLTNITRQDLDLPEVQLAAKLVTENQDLTDIDSVNRVLGQINSKLPGDLQVRFTPIQKIGIIQRIYTLVGFQLTKSHEKRIYETFVGRLSTTTPTLPLTPAQQQQRNDNDMDQLEVILGGKDKVAEFTKLGYSPKDFTSTAVEMNINQGTYEEQLDKSLANVSGTPLTNGSPKQNVLKASYIDGTPELHMNIKSRELYQYDPISGSLQSIADAEKINGENIISRRDLETKLTGYGLSKSELDALYLNLKKPDATLPSSDVDDNIFTDSPPKKKPAGLSIGAIVGIVIGIVIGVILLLVIIGFIYMYVADHIAMSPHASKK